MADVPKLVLGFYRVNDWTCKRFFYWSHIRKIEKNVFNLPFLVGRIVPVGVKHIYEKTGKAVEAVRDKFNEEYKWAMNRFKLDEEEEAKLTQVKFIVMGMIEGYQRMYAKRIGEYNLPKGGNEVSFEYELRKGVVVKGAIDNFLMKKKGGQVLHELKTTARLTPSYVKKIQTDLQHAMYWFIPRKIPNFKFCATEILYDVIRKPSIKQKKGEMYKAFLQRLATWYVTGGEKNVFYSEQIKEPLISEKNMMNTLRHVADEMEEAQENAECVKEEERKMEFYPQNFDMCFRQDFECQFYDLCHRVKNERDMKSVMVDFIPKEKYRK